MGSRADKAWRYESTSIPGLSVSLDGTKILPEDVPSRINLCLTQLGAGFDAARIRKGTFESAPLAGRRSREKRYL